MTLSSILESSRTLLESSGIDNATAEAEWIVGHSLDLTRSELNLDPSRPVPEHQAARIRDAVGRRRKRVPLQYILGDVPFRDCSITVTSDVLIPRPETEWIVDTMADTLPSDIESILDIGTGSGAIATALASACPRVTVTGLDVSPKALGVAKRNATENGVAASVRLLLGDLNALPFLPDSFDCIVSNPPYIRSKDIDGLEPEVRDHEPMLALDGGPDGMDSYRSIARQCRAILRPQGLLHAELPGYPPGPIRELFVNAGYQNVDIRDDLSGKPRHLTAQNPS